MQRAGIISQVRMGSTRLPSKVLLPAAGRPLLDYHVARLAASGLPIILATTTEPADDLLADYAEARALPYHRGSEADVLARYYETALKFGLDAVVRVTSDCPLVDGLLDFEIFSMELLAEAHTNATLPYEREHVTPYIKANPATAGRVVYRDEVWPGGDFSRFRITLDTAEDYEVLRALIEQHGAAGLAVPELLSLLEAHPEIMALNAHIEQKST